MDCDRVREIISAELDGEATRDEAAALATHLDGCADCRRAQEVFAGLCDDLARWELPELDPYGALRVEAALAEFRSRPLAGGARRLARLSAIAAAAGIMIVAGAMLLVDDKAEPGPVPPTVVASAPRYALAGFDPGPEPSGPGGLDLRPASVATGGPVLALDGGDFMPSATGLPEEVGP